MGRKFQHQNRQIVHNWLVEWAAWVSKTTDRSPLGARIGTYEQRGGTTRPPGAICPEVMRPRRLVRIEIAVNDQSPVVQRNIQCYYRMIPPNDRNYIKVTAKAREYFLGRLEKTLFP